MTGVFITSKSCWIMMRINPKICSQADRNLLGKGRHICAVDLLGANPIAEARRLIFFDFSLFPRLFVSKSMLRDQKIKSLSKRQPPTRNAFKEPPTSTQSGLNIKLMSTSAEGRLVSLVSIDTPNYF